MKLLKIIAFRVIASVMALIVIYFISGGLDRSAYIIVATFTITGIILQYYHDYKKEKNK